MFRFAISMMALATITLAAQAADNNKKVANSNGNGNKGVAPTNFHPPKITTTGNSHTVNSSALKPQKLQNLTPKYTAKDYNIKFGKKCDFGWCYKGKHHDHWTCCCWLDECGCTCYWCPCTLVWYYYCVPDNCWYPVSYCPYGVYVW